MECISFSLKEFRNITSPGDLLEFQYVSSNIIATNRTNHFVALLKDLNTERYSVYLNFNNHCDVKVPLVLVKIMDGNINFLYKNKLIRIDFVALKNIFYDGNYIKFRMLNHV